MDSPVIKDGALWRFETEPPSTAWANHQSAVQYSDKLSIEIDRLEAAGLIEFAPAGHDVATFVSNVNPFGAVATGDPSDPKIRMVVDPTITSVDSHMLPLPLSLPSAQAALHMTRDTSVLGKRDLKSGFHHVILQESARKYMGFEHPGIPGKFGRWIALPFGAAQSPAIFCDMTSASARIVNAQSEQRGIKASCTVYVDDYFIVADDHHHMRMAFQVMYDIGAELGLTWNLEKDRGRDVALNRLEFLGSLVDAADERLELPAAKREAYRLVVHQFRLQNLHASEVSRKSLEELVGKLSFAAAITRWGYSFLQEALDALYPGNHRQHGLWPRTVSYTEGLRTELLFWDGSLHNPASIWHGADRFFTGSREFVQSSADMQIFTDASGSFGWGATLADTTMLGRWCEARERDVQSSIIAVKETIAVLRALQHLPELYRHSVVIRSDNVATVAAINRGAARWPGGRQEVMSIAGLAIRGKIGLRAVHMAGVENPAAGPSRGVIKTSDKDFTFAYLSSFAGTIIDCCAASDGYNRQAGCSLWFSAVNPVQLNVDQLVGRAVWAAPPWDVASKVLDAIMSARRRAPLTTEATVVLPFDRTRGWFKFYFRKPNPKFRILHMFPSGCTLYLRAVADRRRFPYKFAKPVDVPVMVVRLGARRF